MKKVTQTDYYERIFKVMLYIEKNLDHDISLDELSSVACFSSYHFHRIFQGMTGESVADYIRRLRIEKAALSIIQKKNVSITDLAFKSGYKTVESFSRAFRNHFGQNPSQFRKEQKAGSSNCISGENIKKIISKGVDMTELKFVKRKEEKIAFVRHTGPYSECGSSWEKLCRWAGSLGFLDADTKFIGICHDDPAVTEPSKIRYDAAMSLKCEVAPSKEVAFSTIPAGIYASYIHTGPFENLYKSYNHLCGELIPASGKEIKNAPSIEVYLNDPEKTPPEELKVEILIPIEE